MNLSFASHPPPDDRSQSSPRRPAPPRALPAVEILLLRVVDGALLAIVLLAPLVFGGRHDFGRFVLTGLVALTAVAWFLRQAVLPGARWVRTSGHALLLLGAALLVLQLVPLPEAWIEAVAPRNAKLLPLWQSDDASAAALGTWRTLSLAPSTTRQALATYIAYGLLFVVACQRLREPDDVRRLLQTIGLSGILMAGFGILQYATSDGRFFWSYEYPFRTTLDNVCGSFTNRNHFAQFLTLTVAPLAVWLLAVLPAENHEQRRRGDVSRWLAGMLAAGLVLVLFAILLSGSRGGAVALLVALAVATGILFAKGLLNVRYLVGTALLGGAVVGLLSFYGYQRVASRLDDLASGSIEQLDTFEGRRTIWAANLAATRDGWLTGSGAGSHRYIYPAYVKNSLSFEYTHAESSYLQIATEMGLPGVLLLAAGLAFCTAWSCRALRAAHTPQTGRLAAAATAGLAASAAHAAVDFVWHIPACMTAVLLLAACQLRLAQSTSAPAIRNAPRPSREIPSPFTAVLPRSRWIELAFGVTLLSAWIVHTSLGPGVASLHWDRYLRTSIASSRLEREQLGGMTEESESQQSVRDELCQAMIVHLQDVLRWHPGHERAHTRLADRLVLQFELGQKTAPNAMSATQIRDAAIASRFAGPDPLRDWLQRAFGDRVALLYRAHHHARCAVRLCPLLGEAYLNLADLCFLDGVGPGAVEAYVEQGLRVKPYDGDVRFEVAKQHLLAGRIDQALSHWIASYRDTGRHQLQIIQLLAGRLPAATFVDSFQPDWKTLPTLWRRYRQFGSAEDRLDLLRHAEQVARRDTPQYDPVTAARIWRDLAVMHVELGQLDAAVDDIHNACRLAPDDFSVRQEAARTCLRADLPAEAQAHLRWCLARQPRNPQLRALLTRVAREGDAASAGEPAVVHATALRPVEEDHQPTPPRWMR